MMQKTAKLTKAMNLVASAKVRKAQKAVIQSRPWNECLQSIFGGLSTRLSGDESLPLFDKREVKSLDLVVIMGDRGLCGGYNNNIIKKATDRKALLESQGIKVSLIVLGKKGFKRFFDEKGKVIDPILKYEMGNDASGAIAFELAEYVKKRFLSGESDACEIIFTKFKNMMTFTPSIRTMLPFSPTEITSAPDEIFQLTTKGGKLDVEKQTIPPAEPREYPSDMIFEQPPEKIVNMVVPLYLNGQVLRTMQESIASEMASRANAMQAATDNANELVVKLRLQFNRARQEAVTQEILEIVGGAEALAQAGGN